MIHYWTPTKCVSALVIAAYIFIFVFERMLYMTSSMIIQLKNNWISLNTISYMMPMNWISILSCSRLECFCFRIGHMRNKLSFTKKIFTRIGLFIISSTGIKKTIVQFLYYIFWAIVYIREACGNSHLILYLNFKCVYCIIHSVFSLVWI